MIKSADIIIIGGGIAGISLAARLAADQSVIVLEAEDQLAYHSTGRSAAMFIRNYGPPVIRSLNRLSEPFLRNHEGFSETPLLSPRGELTLDCGPEEHFFQNYISGSHGLDIIDAKSALELVPILNPKNLRQAAYEPDASEIDVHGLFSGFLRMARAGGVDILTKAKVNSLSRSGTTWTVETSQGSFSSPIVVNAAGAWADQVAECAGVTQCGITPKRRSAVIVPALDGVMEWPMFVPAAEDWYAKPDSGRLMISPADADPVMPHDAYPEDMVLAEGIDRFMNATTLLINRVERSWAGLRSFAPDGDPVVGFDTQMEGFFWLAGQGGYGIQTSPALSKLAASLITGQDVDEDLMHKLNVKRFNN